MTEHLQAAQAMNADLENQALRDALHEAWLLLSEAAMLDQTGKLRAPFLRWDRKVRDLGIVGPQSSK